MQELLLISIGAFIAAALTVPAGFGLSTLLTPLVLFVLPVHEAVAVVAIVHCAHNAGKFLSLREFVYFCFSFQVLPCLVVWPLCFICFFMESPVH